MVVIPFYDTIKLWTVQLPLIAALLKVLVIRPELLQVWLLPCDSCGKFRAGQQKVVQPSYYPVIMVVNLQKAIKAQSRTSFTV